jgi:hypothetical protein
LTTLSQATYLGGDRIDFPDNVAIHPISGEVYVAGLTYSSDFPGTAGGAQPALSTTLFSDGFVARLNTTLTRVNQATYVGGGKGEYLYSLAIHPNSGEVYVAGATPSTDFPGTAGGAQAAINTTLFGDGFVARLNSALTTLNQATYLGGSKADWASAVVVDPTSGDVYAAGGAGPDFPSTAGGAQAAFRASDVLLSNAFVARLTANLALAPPTCSPARNTLCLQGGRFKVQVAWRVPSQGTSGSGVASALTGDTGEFWFFTNNNIELVVKVLDGRSYNGHFWVFYGALSDVEYTLTVIDTQTGLTKAYFNPQGRLGSVADTAAFAATGESAVLSGAPWSSGVASGQGAVCSSDPTSLCLNGDRFRAQVNWRAVNIGTSGVGQAVRLTSDTGYFWFFSGNNIELVLKVVDGRSFNGRFWVFYGALSDVEYTITVTDTQRGVSKTYFNPQGQLASVADTAAF